MFRNKSVSVHQFAMVPRADIPRSSFRMQRALKTTFGGEMAGVATNGAQLIPILVEEILPGDTWNLRMTAFCRLATPLYPVLDNLYLESFFFFVPNRLVWSHWENFMGERFPLTTSTIDYTVPQVVSPVGGWPVSSLAGYMGLPTVGQVGAGATVSSSCLPLRAYRLIWDEWFRDENINDSWLATGTPTGDGPDLNSYYTYPATRGKRHDYFTSCLPFPQKGASVPLPLGTVAPVRTNATDLVTGVQPIWRLQRTDGGGNPTAQQTLISGSGANSPQVYHASVGTPTPSYTVYPSNLYADLSTATAATINQLRQAFQIQRLLERDARGGTRYTEILRAHFGVVSPDARLQRPEYLGGGRSMVTLNPVAQTSATGLTGGTSPQGNLGAMGTSVLANHGFTQSFTEHGYVIGMVTWRADLTYQQGLRRHWSRSTRYDFYFPAFAHLGEQAVLSKEIYCDGSAGDDDVFGYQERWGELRYSPSEITGLFRSTAAGTLDAWHYAQRFTSRPTLNPSFIQEAPPLSRNLAVGAAANGQQFLFDAFFDIKAARPLPMYSVPGLIDHF